MDDLCIHVGQEAHTLGTIPVLHGSRSRDARSACNSSSSRKYPTCLLQVTFGARMLAPAVSWKLVGKKPARCYT